jgi:hypothetical protein
MTEEQAEQQYWQDYWQDYWYSYRETAFGSQDCILWIAHNITTLEAGRWPPPPPGRRMTDGPILPAEQKHRPKNRNYQPIKGQEASFCKPEAIAAELRRRLDLVTGSARADLDRALFEEHCIEGVPLWRLARTRQEPEWLCGQRVTRVLRFVTGKAPLRRMDGQLVTYSEALAKGKKYRKRAYSGTFEGNLTGECS